MSRIDLYNEDCLDTLKRIPDKSIDLIITDPPYLMTKMIPGGKDKKGDHLTKTFKKTMQDLVAAKVDKGFDKDRVLPELVRVSKKINLYVFCNKAQVLDYIDFFCVQNRCSWDMLIWYKPNAPPLYNGKYKVDKEYCLYFRRGGYCQPKSYQDAQTVWIENTNIADKALYNHPTIKPLELIEKLVRNSSREGETVLDPFMGSGTTGVACKKYNRNFIGCEIVPQYFETAKKRIEQPTSEQLNLFE